MSTGQEPAGLQLTEEEAFALLAMCLMSPQAVDKTTESALKKLAEYCVSESHHQGSSNIEAIQATCRLKLQRAGA